MNWLRRILGLHVHDWEIEDQWIGGYCWRDEHVIHTVGLRHVRFKVCQTCPAWRQIHFW